VYQAGDRLGTRDSNSFNAVKAYRDFPVAEKKEYPRRLSHAVVLDNWGDNYSQGEHLCQPGGFCLSPIIGSEPMPCITFRRRRSAHCTTPYTLQQEFAAEAELLEAKSIKPCCRAEGEDREPSKYQGSGVLGDLSRVSR
jgi:hypothetical protein